jgi:hypothetical protein
MVKPVRVQNNKWISSRRFIISSPLQFAIYKKNLISEMHIVFGRSMQLAFTDRSTVYIAHETTIVIWHSHEHSFQERK